MISNLFVTIFFLYILILHAFKKTKKKKRLFQLDKTLLCSRCDKFRCICERPLSTSSMASSSTSTTTINKNSSNNLFGTNIFQRFTQKVSGITTDNSNNVNKNKQTQNTKITNYS